MPPDKKIQIHLDESELVEEFSRSSGPGGQNVNKVSTRVVLRHLPTGLVVTVQDARSQAANRALARERLIEALAERQRKAAADLRDRRERLRRQASPRPRGLKRRILESKRRRALVKRQRGSVPSD